MSKIKPVRRLLHQFGRLLASPRLSEDEIALALTRAGLIRPVAFATFGVTHYEETDLMRSVSPDRFRATCQDALVRYHRGARRRFVTLTEVTLLRNSEWQAKVRAGDLETAERKALGLRGHQADLLLEAYGECVGSGMRDEFSFQLSPVVTIFNGAAHIDGTTARFDEDALERTLEGQFDHARHEEDWLGCLIDRAHDSLQDGD